MTFDVSSCSDKSEFFFLLSIYILQSTAYFVIASLFWMAIIRKWNKRRARESPWKSFGLVLPINDIDHHISAEEQNNFCAQLDFVKLKRLKKKKFFDSGRLVIIPHPSNPPENKVKELMGASLWLRQDYKSASATSFSISIVCDDRLDCHRITTVTQNNNNPTVGRTSDCQMRVLKERKTRNC